MAYAEEVRIETVAVVLLGLAVALSGQSSPGKPTSSRTVVIGTINLAPHSIEDPSTASFSRDLFTEALESQGWSVRIEFFPWARAFQLGKDGTVDGVWPSIYQKEREEWFEFSRPVLNTNYVLLKAVGSPIKITQLPDAKPYRIGVLRGGITGSALDGSTEFLLEEAGTFGQNLQKLAAGRIDLMTAERYNGLHMLSHDFPELEGKVEMISPPISTISLHLMFSKKAPDIEAKRAAFEKGIQTLKANGRLAALFKKYGYAPSALVK